MSPASQIPLVNRSKLEAEIQCGSHAGICHGQGQGQGQGHTDFLYSRIGCVKRRGQANILSFRGWKVSH